MDENLKEHEKLIVKFFDVYKYCLCRYCKYTRLFTYAHRSIVYRFTDAVELIEVELFVVPRHTVERGNFDFLSCLFFFFFFLFAWSFDQKQFQKNAEWLQQVKNFVKVHSIVLYRYFILKNADIFSWMFIMHLRELKLFWKLWREKRFEHCHLWKFFINT